MSLKLDLGKLRYVSSDKHSTTLKHPAGHTVTIAHNVLSPENQKALKALSSIGAEHRTASQTQEEQDQHQYGKIIHKAEGGEVKYKNEELAEKGRAILKARHTKSPEEIAKLKERQQKEDRFMRDTAGKGMIYKYADGGTADDETRVATPGTPHEDTGKVNTARELSEGSKKPVPTSNWQQIKEGWWDAPKKAEGGEIEPYHCKYCHGGPAMAHGGNVGEQRKKAVGTQSSPANAKMREKHMEMIRDFAKSLLKLTMEPSGGKINPKTGERRDKDIEVGKDKPDWRSGKLESQANPDAMIHELAHLMLLPKGVGLKKGQELMDKQYADVQKQHGYMKQKRSQGEIQPMAAENIIRRHIGLPAATQSVPVEPGQEPRMAVDTGTPAAIRAPKGEKTVDLIRQSRLLSPENRERIEHVMSGRLKFHPEMGWQENPEALGAKSQMYKEEHPEAIRAAAEGGEIQHYDEGGDIHAPDNYGGGTQYAEQPAATQTQDVVKFRDASAKPAPTTQAAQVPSDKVAIQKLYNSIVNTGAASSGSPSEQQFNPNQSKFAMFGPNGEPPQSFDANAYTQAKEMYAKQQADAAGASNERVAKIQADNAVRQEAGLPPLPIPGQEAKPAEQPATTPQPNSMETNPYDTMPAIEAPQEKAAQQDEGINTQVSSNPQELLQTGGQQMLRGIAGQAEAQGQLGVQQALAEQKNIESQQTAQDAYKKQFDALNSERLNMVKDIQKGYINPDHYWTGDENGNGSHSKIAAGIGMILGGIGNSPQGNVAMNYLKYQMDRDLEAQKTNLGQKNNLLAANLQQFGNLRDATTMTRMMQSDILVNELQKAAMTATTPMAKAAALQAAGKIQMELAPQMQTFAMRTAMMNLANGGGDPQSIEHMLGYMRAVNPEMAKEMESRYVPGIGLGTIPIPTPARDRMAAFNTTMKQLHQAINFKQDHPGAAWSLQDRAQAQTLMSNLGNQVRVAEDMGVFKASEAAMMKQMLGNSPASFLSAIQTNPKLKEMLNLKAMEQENLYKMYGLKPPAQQPEAPKPIRGKDGKMYIRQGNFMVPVGQ